MAGGAYRIGRREMDGANAVTVQAALYDRLTHGHPRLAGQGVTPRAGWPRMAVREPVVQRCLDCHGIQTAHLAASDSACATCHVSLVRAASLTRQDVADFPAPPSHAAPDFLSRGGHGAVSRQAMGT